MKIKNKIIATIMLTILLSSNLLNIGAQVIAISNNLPEQNSKTNISNVEFNSYLEGETHEKTFNTLEEGKIYLNLKVKENGYLKNGIIELKDINFNVDSSQIESEYIQKIENGKIYLEQIQSEKEVTIELPIIFAKNNKIDNDYFLKDTKTIFTANYIDKNGNERKVEKTVTNRIGWQVSSEAEITGELNKYIPYHIKEEYGVIFQVQINTNIKNNELPIAETNLEVMVPSINNQKPTRVNVIANSTKSTNGSEEGLNSIYTYDSENEKVIIKTLNEANSEGKVTWGEGKDEYIITYIYTGEEVYNYVQEQLKTAQDGKLAEEVNSSAVKGSILVKANIKSYNAKMEVVELEKEISYTVNEKKGEISDFTIEAPKTVSKSYLYANYDKKDNKKETTYDITYKAQIYDKLLNNEIEYEINNEKIEYRNELYSVENNIYLKQIRISEDNFLKILGEEGKIEVSKKDGTTLGSITKQSEKDENGNYILTLEEKSSEVIIKMSNPVAEGKLEVTVTKAFLLDHQYTKSQMKEITKLETEVVAKTNESTKTLTSKIELQEIVNKAEISVSEENLSTVLVNEDIQIRVVLDTSSISNALYKNPTLKIKLPSYISNLNIKSSDIIMSNGLKIKNVKQEKENGLSVIIIELEGTQKDYTIGAEYKGTIIILNTDITVKTLTPTNENKIELTYRNENEAVANKEGKAEAKLNFVAPKGVVAANSIANYAKQAKTVMSISSNTAIAQLETYAEKKIATVTGTIVNNYGNKITNLKVLGRLPSKDNKKIDMEEELGSTFNATINSEIKVTGLEKYKVYYSNKVDANTNLEDTQNGWTEEFSKSAKSYMIVADESYEMDEQNTVEFSYEIEIPANLSYNNSSYEMYKVYYTNVSPVGAMEESKESAIINATTGAGPELEVKLESSIDTVREGQTVKMRVTVTNTGDMNVTDASINIPKPEYSSFVEYENTVGFSEIYDEEQTISLGTIKPGETVTKYYYVKIDNNISNEEPEFISQVTVVGNEIQKGIPSNEYKASIKTGEIKLELIGNIEDGEKIKDGQELKFKVKIAKTKDLEDINNITVTVPLLKETIYKEAYIYGEDGSKLTEGITYNSDEHTLQAILNSVGTNVETIYINLEGTEANTSDSMVAVAKDSNGEEYYSNIFECTYSKVDLQISELTSTPKYVKEGEEITYTLSITNLGSIDATTVKVQDILPTDLLLTLLSYKIEGQEARKVTISNNNIAELTIPILEAGNSVTITITAKAKVINNVEEKQVKNLVNVSADYFEKVQTNTVTNTIEYNKEVHNQTMTDTPSNGQTNTPTTSTYKIMGTAWLDENKDGKRDETEKLLSNIPVVLINKANNTVVTDINTNEQKRTTTTNKGTYEFTNIPKGEYLVLFLYDSSSYSITKYQVEGIDEDLNSDAIDINIVFEGERRIAGISDVVKVTSSNVRDIDIGLYVSEKFDLRLDKYISKITLTTPTIGTRVTNYNDTQLAKVEILGKNVNKSSIIVEYKIKVTNEGKIAGYAKKLIDYLPEGASFSSEINKEWYLSDNNKNVYNTSLANTIINPGESKEVTLILSFNITDKNIGNIVNNNAEIYESYNEEGKVDIDSVAGNNASEEDDISKADIVLSVVTGKLVVGSMLIVVVLAILVFGIYEIKKKVLTKRVD